MPISFYDRNGELQTVDDEFDTKGNNLAHEHLSKKYKTGQILFSNSKSNSAGEQVFIPDGELKDALASGKFETKELAAAKAQKLGITKTQAVIQGLRQGGTLGLADEFDGAVASPLGAAKTALNLLGGKFEDEDTKKYKKVRDTNRNVVDAAQEEQTAAYLMAELVGGAAVPIPGLAAAKGASLGVRVAKGAGKAAIEGSLQGLGSSKADNGLDLAKDVATAGALSGGLSTVPAAAGQVYRGAKKFIPGASGSSKVANKVASEAGGLLGGLTNRGKQTFQDFLNDPARYNAAREAGTDLIENPQKYTKTVNELVERVESTNKTAQNKLRGTANGFNVTDPNYRDALDGLSSKFGKELDAANTAPVSSTYRGAVEKALAAIKGESLTGVRSKMGIGLGEAQAYGGQLHESRKLLDDALNQLENQTKNQSSQEYIDLMQLRRIVDEKLKGLGGNPIASGKLTQHADSINSEAAKTKTALGQMFQSASGKEVDNAKAFRFWKRSGGDENAIRIEDALAQVDEYGKSLNASDEIFPLINARHNLSRQLKPLQDSSRLNRLAGESGSTTGKSAGALALTVGATMAAGPAGLLAGPATFISQNPAGYLALINGINRGEKRAIETFKKLPPDLKQAVDQFRRSLLKQQSSRIVDKENK